MDGDVEMDSARSEEPIRIYELDPTPTKYHTDYRSSMGDDRFKIMYFRDGNTGLNYDTRSGELINEGGCIRSLAHCHGLFCIAVAREILLWNPSTKQTRKLPQPEIDDCDGATNFFGLGYCGRATLFFGLGHDSSSDDYKLVSVCVFEALEMPRKVKVYSRNKGTWQRIQDFPHPSQLLIPAVYANGCLYWKAKPSGLFNSIIALDLASNSFCKPPKPDNGASQASFEIGALDDQLVVFFEFSVIIWFLKEDGGWLLNRTILDCNLVSFNCYEPMCMLKKSGIALFRVAFDEVAVFDMEKNEGPEEYFKFPVDKDTEFRMVGFVGSRVSPYADVAQEEEDASVVQGNALCEICTMTLRAMEDIYGYDEDEVKEGYDEDEDLSYPPSGSESYSPASAHT